MKYTNVMSKARLRVSIVIPAYNEECHIKECLDSIAEQTVRPFEVIVVDNNSKDRTAEIARSFSFVTLTREKKQGLIPARNTGLNLAKGDILSRIDADVQLPRNWVEHLQRFYAQSSHDSLACSSPASFYNIRLPAAISSWCTTKIFEINKLLTGSYTLWGTNMVVTAQQWRRIRRYVCDRKDIHEDLDMSIHLRRAGYRIFYDRSIKVKAELKRMQSDRHLLKDYLTLYPTTLRVHKSRVWLPCWFLGVPTFYYVSFALVIVDKVFSVFGRFS